MTLRELKVGQSARIEAVGGEGALRQHFLDMGVIPGAEVTLVKLAPMGDPMELRIHGYELTLRLADAEKIDAVPIERLTESAVEPGKRQAQAGPPSGSRRRGQVSPQGHRRSPAGGNHADLCPGG